MFFRFSIILVEKYVLKIQNLKVSPPEYPAAPKKNVKKERKLF